MSPDPMPSTDQLGEPNAADGHEPSERPSLGSIVEAATAPVRSVARPIGRGVGRLAASAQRSLRSAPGARVRRVRRMGHHPLPNLYDVHREAHHAAQRELGLRTVPIEAIHGTAVEGPDQRGGDFLPLKQLRGADWRARWQRILEAIDKLVALPPVELVKFGDEYWVVDGHNRVAAGLYNGQVAIDAVVTELRAPGIRAEPARPIAAYLLGSQDLRAAGEGRLTRTAIRPLEWEVLPDAIAGGRGAADPGDDPPADPADIAGGHHEDHAHARFPGPDRPSRAQARQRAESPAGSDPRQDGEAPADAGVAEDATGP